MAVLPPDDALDELGGAVGRLKALPGAESLRWTGVAQWHLTLTFLGEVAEESLPELCERLARAARRHPPMTLRLAGGGRFGDGTLWAGVTGETAALGRLADSVAAAARRTGIEVEERPFTAHLTLARNRDRSRHRTRLRPFADQLADFGGREWSARELELVRSNPPALGVAGAQPRYETLRTWPLGGRVRGGEEGERDR